MNLDEIIQKIKAMVADIAECEPEEIGMDAHFFKDLGIDSIKAIEMAVKVERMFGISVRDDQIKDITTLRQASEIVKKMLDQAGRK